MVHPEHVLTKNIHKYITRMAKMVAEVEEDYARAFMPYLPSYLEFSCSQILNFVPGQLPDKYVIHNMIFLK